MTMRTRLTAAAAALALTTVLAACGNSDDPQGGTTIPGIPNVNTPLKDTDWFRSNFGSPLVAVGNVNPKTIERPNDLKGTALPQTNSPLDGPVLWERVRCAAVPFTTTAGPTKLRGDAVWGGYAHNQLGAALAAYQMRVAPWTSTDAKALITTAAPADRDRVWKRLELDTSKPNAGASDADCVLSSKRAPFGLVRPARWNTQDLGSGALLVSFWFPPAKPSEQGFVNDIAVQWVGDDWYLTDQELTKSAMGESGVPTAEPAGWSTW